WVEDRDQTPLPPFQDRFDVHQLFADVRLLGPDVPLTVRFGRQELSYGKQRLVSPLDWANVKRSWDALKIFWSDKNWNVDAWYGRPVDIRNLRRDTYDEDVHFYGLYSTYKGIKDQGIDAYFLALDNTGQYTNANFTTGDVGDLSLYTLGTRLFGKTPVGPHAWDYDTEFAGQWGKAAGDTVQAWMWSADTGYTLADWPLKPRVGIGIDYASGDDDPFDDIHGTFNQLFPLGHAFFGYLDQVGRQNVWAQNVNLTLKPHDAVTTQLAFHTFWLDKNQDALYNAAGVPLRRNVHGDVGDLIGNELDLTIAWQIDPHASVLFGYSHLWASSHFFNRRNQPDEDPDLFYVQYQYKF
ncbi:MAG: alginate export family protein, partial [Planctomycetes bacterium]|nr:alginate export family protein [Planctomycetota bacterium]